jgi:hypothetical protein
MRGGSGASFSEDTNYSVTVAGSIRGYLVRTIGVELEIATPDKLVAKMDISMLEVFTGIPDQMGRYVVPDNPPPNVKTPV